MTLAKLVLILIVGAPTVADTPVQDIKALRRASNAAIAAGDAGAVVAQMADDMVLTTGASEKITGPADIQAAFEAVWAAHPDAVYIRTPKSVKISRSGSTVPLAWEDGSWVGRWVEDGGAVEYSGLYSAGWRKGPLGWQLHSELFVTLTCKGAGCP